MMKLNSKCILVLVAFVLVSVEYSKAEVGGPLPALYNINVGSKLNGRTIHIEGLRERGKWIQSAETKWVSINSKPEIETFYDTSYQFTVKYNGNGQVLLMSKTFKHHYVNTRTDHWVDLVFSSYPKNVKAMHWEIKCTTDDMKDCVFESAKYKNYFLYPDKKGWVALTHNYWKNWCRFRVLAPTATEAYQDVFTTENLSDVPQKKTMKLVEGIVDTNKKSHTVSSSVSKSIYGGLSAGAFFIGGLGGAIGGQLTTKHTNVWKNTQISTASSSKSFSYTLTVPAHSKIVLKQLKAKYGPFDVFAKKFQVVQTNLKSDEMSFFQF